MRLRLEMLCSALLVLPLNVAAQDMLRQQTVPATTDKIEAETPEAKKLKAENAEKAKELLNRVYGTTKNLSDSDKAAVLARLAAAGSRVMPEQSKAWADEVFQVTPSISSDNSRGQYEMTALLAVAENDPDHALRLLMQMSPPGTSQDGTTMMDLRGPASAGLFQKYWQKRGEQGLPALQSTAREMGEVGLYPFMAMGPIIRAVARKDPDKAKTLVSEALIYFPRLQQSDMSGQEMAMFLRMNRELIATSTLKDVLSQLVSKALAAKDNGTSGMMMTSVSTNGNTATLKGASNLMMFQLMPLIKEVDPEWAKKLEDQNQQLRDAAVTQQNSPSGTNTVRMGVFMGGGGPNAQGNPIDPLKVAEVDELSQKDPVQALKVSDEISDPALRAATSVRLAGDINATDPEQAARLIKSAKEAMAATPEPADKLRILAGLAQAQSDMHDSDGLSATLKQGFAMGEELYRKSVDKNPSATVNNRPGIDSLQRMTGAGVKADLSQTVEDIGRLSSPALQAMLLISAAQSLDPDMKAQDTGFRIMIRN